MGEPVSQEHPHSFVDLHLDLNPPDYALGNAGCSAEQ